MEKNQNLSQNYLYKGDRFTDPIYKNRLCYAVKRPDGKCIRGKNGSMVVKFYSGQTVVVLGRQLRKVEKLKFGNIDPESGILSIYKK